MPFQPGQSGNPGGRPKQLQELKDLAREHSAEAIEKLVQWMRSDNPKASVSAANALLDRGFGRPTQAHAGADGEGPVEVLTRIERVIVDPQNKNS